MAGTLGSELASRVRCSARSSSIMQVQYFANLKHELKVYAAEKISKTFTDFEISSVVFQLAISILDYDDLALV